MNSGSIFYLIHFLENIFLEAASKGDIAALENIITNENLVFLNELRQNALHLSSQKGHLKVVQFLTEIGSTAQTQVILPIAALAIHGFACMPA